MARNDKWRPELWATDRFSTMRDLTYAGGEVACPECFAPTSRKRKDGRCTTCLHDRDLLPVNFHRRPKSKSEEDED